MAIKKLTRTGNSETLAITKEMKQHLGLSGNEIEVVFADREVILRKPSVRSQFEVAVAETIEQYDNALRELAK
jgi:antitoxin component of MazEF toxin-antitoxin module